MTRGEHLAKCQTLNKKLALRAVAFLRDWLGPKNIKFVQDEGLLNEDWWIPFHHGTMRGVRNLLRSHGFGEQEFGIDNLDDYAVGLVELACDLTTLDPPPPAKCHGCGKGFGDEGVTLLVRASIYAQGQPDGSPVLAEEGLWECNMCREVSR